MLFASNDAFWILGKINGNYCNAQLLSSSPLDPFVQNPPVKRQSPSNSTIEQTFVETRNQENREINDSVQESKYNRSPEIDLDAEFNRTGQSVEDGEGKKDTRANQKTEIGESTEANQTTTELLTTNHLTTTTELTMTTQRIRQTTNISKPPDAGKGFPWGYVIAGIVIGYICTLASLYPVILNRENNQVTSQITLEEGREPDDSKVSGIESYVNSQASAASAQKSNQQSDHTSKIVIPTISAKLTKKTKKPSPIHVFPSASESTTKTVSNSPKSTSTKSSSTKSDSESSSKKT